MTDEFDGDAMLRGAIDCAIGALAQELDHILHVDPLGDRASRTELVSWVKGFDRDHRVAALNEILSRRNPWALKLGLKADGFWDLVDQQLGITR